MTYKDKIWNRLESHGMSKQEFFTMVKNDGQLIDLFLGKMRNNMANLENSYQKKQQKYNSGGELQLLRQELEIEKLSANTAATRQIINTVIEEIDKTVSDYNSIREKAISRGEVFDI